VVLGGTDGSDATGVQTGIHTLLVHTGPFRSALGADHALGLAIRRLVDESCLAGAHRLVVHGTAVAVGSTGRRIAWIQRRTRRDRHRFAAEERISSVSRRTVTSGHMFVNCANGVVAADIVARIDTLESRAGLDSGALIVILALSSASSLGIIGITLESFVAVAGSSSISLATLGMWATGRGFAGRGR